MITTLKSTRAGFTLVELIVVIAILGILAGIAVPVYSGYIDKAGEAADLQLLSAMNTAFTASCAEMGIDPTTVVGQASLDKGLITSVTASGRDIAGNAIDNDRLNRTFSLYYGDNANTPFKVYTSLGYDKINGVFVDGAKAVSAMYNGKEITVSMADLTKYLASGFAKLEGGTAELMGDVDYITAAAAAFLGAGTGNAGKQVLRDANFQKFLKENLKLTDEEILQLGDNSDPVNSKRLANALVLYTASKSSGMNAEDVIDQFNKKGTWMQFGDLSSGMSMVDGAVGATIPYAMMLAYANSEYAKDNPLLDGEYPVNTVNYNGESVDWYSLDFDAWEAAIFSDSGDATGTYYDPTFGATIAYDEDEFEWTIDGKPIWNYVTTETFYKTSTPVKDYFDSAEINKLSDIDALQKKITTTDGFKAYMQSEQAKSDLNGFFSAMTMLDSNTDNLGTAGVNSVLTNGFTDPDLVAMLNAIIGG